MSYFLENEEVEKVEEVKEQDGIASIEPLLDNRIVRAIREMGFEKLSPIQEQAIPYLLQGEDIIGQAQTGTGKTAAFGIPAIQHINPDVKKLQTIILCPTRSSLMVRLRIWSMTRPGVPTMICTPRSPAI